MKQYVFTNRHGTFLYSGYHKDEESAWIAFWDKCQYPTPARDRENDLKLGIKVNYTS